MRYLLFLLVAVSLGSCYPQHPLTHEPAQNNQTYKVEYLFQQDGCKVYRFWDRGYYVYFTNCSGDAVARTDSTAVQNSTRMIKP